MAGASEASEALDGKKEESVVVMETQAKASEARASIVESSMWITRSAMKAMAAMAKVKRRCLL